MGLLRSVAFSGQRLLLLHVHQGIDPALDLIPDLFAPDIHYDRIVTNLLECGPLGAVLLLLFLRLHRLLK